MEIRLKNVCYKNIFNDINLTINQNKITAIVGKNGSGKTAIMNLIYGLDKDFLGEIKIGKFALNRDTKKQSIINLRKNISYIRQYSENDLFNSNIYNDIKCDVSNLDDQKLYELLETFELSEDILNKNYLDLNSSEKRKILIVKSLMKDSKIMMFDDITRDLDYKSIEKLIKILKRKKRDGKTIILSSIDSDFLVKIADSFMAILDNKIIMADDKYSFFSNLELINSINMNLPKIIEFKMLADTKKTKMLYRDNINDLIKDIYRNVKE